jgi:hypothetical protein
VTQPSEPGERTLSSPLSEADKNELWAALEVAAHRAALADAVELLRRVGELHFSAPGGVCAFCGTRYPCDHARIVAGAGGGL